MSHLLELSNKKKKKKKKKSFPEPLTGLLTETQRKNGKRPYSGHLSIADTFFQSQWCPLCRGLTNYISVSAVELLF